MAYTTINKPNLHFNTVLWTGANTTASRTITGVGFQPDLVWGKSRDTTVGNYIYDAVRGTGANKELFSSAAVEEGAGNLDSYDYLSSFNSDGFASTFVANEAAYFNTLNRLFVAWNWKANGVGSANTVGTISSTVSANTTSGFSIVTWTGNGSSSATVGHGLSVAPEMIFVKARTGTNAANNWFIYHKNLSANNNLIFTSAGQLGTGSYSSGVVATPTSSTIGFTAGSSVVNVNEAGTTFVAYCFASIKAFSKIGAYTGNGSNDGTFVYTGFKPAFVMIKKYSTTGEDWFLWDNKRAEFNVAQKVMRPNSSSVETDVVYDGMDILSNGFKLRYNDTRSNGSGLGYVYMAFAEQPLVGTNNVPCTAR
jgi:hypothetical protein